MVKVLIVDNNLIFMNGIKTILEQDNNIMVIGCAENTEKALQICKKLSPDVALIDINLLLSDQFNCTKLIKIHNDKIKIIILAAHNDNQYIQDAFDSNTDGFILKDIGSQDLVRIIKIVASGFFIINQSILQNIKSQYSINFNTINSKQSLDIKLSHREINILKLLADGNCNREIAAALNLAEGTVRNTISSLLEKFKVKDRTQLAIFAIKNNLFNG